MMGCLDLKAHIFQSQHHITSRIFPEINWSHVKIACLFMWSSVVGHPSIIRMEQEKFTLRSHIKRIAHIRCLFTITFCKIYRGSPSNGVPSGLYDITDQYVPLCPAADATERSSNVSRSGCRYISDSSMRTNPSMAEPSNMQPVIQRFFQLTGCNGHIFHDCRKYL